LHLSFPDYLFLISTKVRGKLAFTPVLDKSGFDSAQSSPAHARVSEFVWFDRRLLSLTAVCDNIQVIIGKMLKTCPVATNIFAAACPARQTILAPSVKTNRNLTG
jgi:hypothetical protein